jgi:DNA-binding NarL/FixJ family response regulator
MTRRITVIIADDHGGARAGVRQVLEADGGFEVVAAVADGPTAVAAALEHMPDVCLVDVHMPGGGVEAAREITNRLAGTAVVMLSVSDTNADLFAALEAGAIGYLLKDMDPDRLPAAVRGALAGEAALPRVMVTRVLEELRGRGERRLALPGPRTVVLTKREWEVLELLRSGRTTAQVADALFLSPVTVRRHVSGILGKLRVPDRESALELVGQGRLA